MTQPNTFSSIFKLQIMISKNGMHADLSIFIVFYRGVSGWSVDRKDSCGSKTMHAQSIDMLSSNDLVVQYIQI